MNNHQNQNQHTRKAPPKDIKKDLRKIIHIVESANIPISEVEVTDETGSLRICFTRRTDATGGAVLPHTGTNTLTTMPAPSTSLPPTTNTPLAPSSAPSSPAGTPVTSPMVGTVYLTPSPDAEPFVKIGQAVQEGDTLCLIEAMKMYSKIEAETAGVVRDCLVESGQPIEYGQTLFIMDEAG